MRNIICDFPKLRFTHHTVFNMGATNPGNMMQIQQQQQQQHGTFGNIAQNLQQGVMPLQNVPQNHPSYQQQRPQGQQ